MYNLIPPQFYTTFYFVILLFIVIIYFIFTQRAVFDTQYKFNQVTFSFLGFFTLFFTIWFMGTRPLSGRYFVDMATYNDIFILMKVWGRSAVPQNDKVFFYYMFISTRLMSSEKFFLLTAFLYTFPLFIVSKKIFKKYWFYCFLLFVSSFHFGHMELMV